MAVHEWFCYSNLFLKILLYISFTKLHNHVIVELGIMKCIVHKITLISSTVFVVPGALLNLTMTLVLVHHHQGFLVKLSFDALSARIALIKVVSLTPLKWSMFTLQMVCVTFLPNSCFLPCLLALAKLRGKSIFFRMCGFWRSTCWTWKTLFSEHETNLKCYDASFVFFRMSIR